MKKIALTFLVSGISFLTILSTNFGYAEETFQQHKSSVLVLFSYHNGMPWSELSEKGIRSELSRRISDGWDVDVEHLDLGRNRDEVYESELKEFLNLKYINKTPSFIIAEDTPVAQFLLKFKEELFQQTPIVFSVSKGVYENFKGEFTERMYAATSKTDPLGTFELAINLFPNTKNVFVIAGSSITDKISEIEFKKAVQKHEKSYTFHYLSNLPYDDIVKNIAAIPENSIVISLMFLTDINRRNFIPYEVAAEISAKANGPVFSLWSTIIGSGIIGGRVVSAEDRGIESVKLGLNIINHPETVHARNVETSNLAIFDWRQLERWKINESDLPKGSAVAYKEANFYELYKKEIFLWASILCLEFFLIVFLIKTLIKKQKTELELINIDNKLRESEELHRITIENILDPIFITDDYGSFIFISPNVFLSLGLTQDDIRAKESLANILGQDILLSNLENRKNEIRNIEKTLETGLGRRIFLINLKAVNILGGTALYSLRDVTELKLAEKENRESENRYRILFENANDAIFKIGISDDSSVPIFLDVNKVACERYGYTQNEFLRMGPEQLDAPDSDVKMQGRLDSFRHDIPTIFETVHLTKNGLRIPVEISVRSYDFDGANFAIAIARDISERKESERILKESEIRYRTLANSGLALIWTSGVDKNCDFFNQVWLEFTGKTLEQELGNGWLEGVHPDDFKRTYDIYSTAFDKREPFRIDYRLRHNDGTYHWIQDIGTPRYNSIGDFIGYIGHCLDVTDRKNTKMSLVRSEMKIRTILDSIDEGFYEVTLNGTVRFCNDAMCRIFGHSKEILIGMNYRQFTDTENAEKIYRSFNDVFKTGRPTKEFDWMIVRGDLKTRYVEVSVSLLKDESNAPIGFSGVIRDITGRIEEEVERKELEIKLQQAQKMEAIGTLAGGIAHDFNNILGSILGYTEMVRDDCFSDSMSTRNLDQVIKATTRAKDLVKQILSFSRQSKVEKIKIQPSIIVKEAIKLLRASLPTTILIKEEYATDPNLILADPTQLHQIIMNLGTNAFHAMEENGGILSVSLSIKTVLPDDIDHENDVNPGNFLKISLRDNGSGIPPEIRNRIFDPYFTTKESGKGTGLGLAMVHGIVKNHGGFITCDSEIGTGTVFSVFLPLLSGETIDPESNSLEVIPTGTEHILFVDDEEMLAQLGQTMLARLGYTVTMQTSSIEALSVFEKQPDIFDLVITDQTMPRMTGIDLANKILQIKPNLPVILCTGFSTQINDEKISKIGIKKVVYKPISNREIAVLIRNTLDGTKYQNLN